MAQEETKENQKLYTLLLLFAFLVVVADIFIYGLNYQNKFITQLSNLSFFSTSTNMKLSILVLLSLVGIGTKSKKKLDLNVLTNITLPLIISLVLLFTSKYIAESEYLKSIEIAKYNLSQIMYVVFMLVGSIGYVVAIGNITKIVKSNIGKDRFNRIAESFLQEQNLIETTETVNIPTRFYYNKKMQKGWININPFRGTLIIGVPGSGKSFGLINPFIRQMIQKNFTMCLYDFKYPDQASIAYASYLKNGGHEKGYRFAVLDMNNIKNSVRVNPISPSYIRTINDAQETAICFIEAMQKSDSDSGGEKFFTESAQILLGSAIYFLLKHENGKYCTIPHLISLICSEYKILFDILFSNVELGEKLTTYFSSYKNKAFDQLEGQVGTLRISLGKLVSKELYYLFGKDEVKLNLSNKKNPTILILASDPSTQGINSSLYSVVVNRITSLTNSKGNLPFGLIVDEAPTLYIYKVDNVISTARSNKVGVVLGMQEIPQLKKNYGNKTADIVQTVNSNIFSGAARNETTLKWLEGTFGKQKQMNHSVSINRRDTSVSINEKAEYIIPKERISQLNTGEIVGLYAKDIDLNESAQGYTERIPPLVNAKIVVDKKMLEEEKQIIDKYPIPLARKFKGTDEEFDDFLIQNMIGIRNDISKIYKSIKEESSDEK